MPDYHVFGGCLRCDLDFGELRPAAGAEPNWTLNTLRESPTQKKTELLGEDSATAEAKVYLYRTPDGFLLEYDDTGVFDIRDSGTKISWYPGPEADLDACRADILGRVLPVAMHSAGVLSLHGSATHLSSGAIAMLAPKFHGKSTLAGALVAAGGKLLSDDAVPVEFEPSVMVRPGVHGLRLWEDSARRVDGNRTTETGAGGKMVLSDFPEAQLMLEPTPLSAIYLLSPYLPDGERTGISREKLSPVLAALALVRHNKLGSLLGQSEAANTLDRAASLTKSVPVYSLFFPRDFELLDDVVEQLKDWHN